MHQRNNLTTERKGWSLTQDEVGLLVGVSGDSVASFEASTRLPQLSTALALSIAFGVPLIMLFPETYHQAARRVTEAAQILSVRLESATDLRSERKKRLLAELGERLREILPI